jgi:hypothetical protein
MAFPSVIRSSVRAPYDLVVNDGWMGDLDANWDVDEMARLLRVWAQRALVITVGQNASGSDVATRQ